MGCTSSKHYSSEGETKGTTLLGLLYEVEGQPKGLLVAADSRSSTEKRLDKPLKIKNDEVKMFEISSSIIAVMSGTAIDCLNMCRSVRSKCITEFKKNGDSVVYALRQMSDHLRGLPENIKNDKAFGVLLAGWDAEDGLQLYRIFTQDGRVTNKTHSLGSVVLGSVSKYAQSIINFRYQHGKSTEDEVAKIALEALFNSTFFDKFTGGILRRYKIVPNEAIITMPDVDPFDVPNPVVSSLLDCGYYTLQEYQSRILFVVYSTTRFLQPIFTDQLINHFRKYGGKEEVKAVAAHLVVKKQDFYFHRVVFKSEEDAVKVWNYVKKNSQTSHQDTFDLLRYFPYQLVLESGAPVYVSMASEDLSQLIHSSSNAVEILFYAVNCLDHKTVNHARNFISETMIRLFKVKEKQQELVDNAKEKAPVKKQSAGELRVQRDITELNLPNTISIAFPHGQVDLMNFEVTIEPDEGYYQGGRFVFTFEVTPVYPHEAPKVKCDTKVYHPNIDLEGNICLNILREDWKPVLNISTVIYGLYYLFTQPNYEDPLNHEAAEVLRDHPETFESNVKRAIAGDQWIGSTYFPRPDY
ncbi:hypothetical protein ACLB2K_015334 [Fragaria x ananassa]